MVEASKDNLTVEEVAVELRRRDRSTRELLRKKKIPSFREGRRRLVRRVDLDAYIAAKSKTEDIVENKATQ